jgi:hypothetical protein
MVMSFLRYVNENKTPVNQQALSELFELFLVYEICENNSANLLRVNFIFNYIISLYCKLIKIKIKLNVIDSDQLKAYQEKLYNLLPIIRVNAVTLVDSFDYLDSNLCD